MADPIAGLRKRQRFILDDSDLELLAAASKPRLLTLADQQSPQGKANEAWELVGLKHGFIPSMGVRQDPNTKDRGIILAIPTDPDRVEPPLPSNDLGGEPDAPDPEPAA